MRRRRFLAASLSMVAGCTAGGYRATGPRIPPRAPETDAAPAAPVDPIEARAQAVIKPLNDVYRFARGPLGTFDVEDVSADERATVAEALARARERLASFSQNVSDPPEKYRSLSALVTAHELLFDGLVGAVDVWSSLSDVADSGDATVGNALDGARSATETLTTAATALGAVVEGGPIVPASMFLTVERMREFATTLETQSSVSMRLVRGSDQTLAAVTDWRTALDAFASDAFTEARASFDDARIHYRAAGDVLEGPPDAQGSFADLHEAISCVAGAGIDATALGFDATDAAVAGDVARAEGLLERAETARTRCAN